MQEIILKGIFLGIFPVKKNESFTEESNPIESNIHNIKINIILVLANK